MENLITRVLNFFGIITKQQKESAAREELRGKIQKQLESPMTLESLWQLLCEHVSDRVLRRSITAKLAERRIDVLIFHDKEEILHINLADGQGQKFHISPPRKKDLQAVMVLNQVKIVLPQKAWYDS